MHTNRVDTAHSTNNQYVESTNFSCEMSMYSRFQQYDPTSARLGSINLFKGIEVFPEN